MFPTSAYAGVQKAAQPPAAPEGPAGSGEPFPASPPPEVLDSLDTAGRVLQELEAARIDLHFEIDGSGASKRVHVQVRDADGRVVREIPAGHALDVMSGDRLPGLVFDERD
jgi:flagellar protein FlaG